MDGWYIGNIVFGGLIGWLVVDPASGAMWKLQDSVHGNLEAKEEEIAEAGPEDQQASDDGPAGDDTGSEDSSTKETADEKSGNEEADDTELSEARERLQELKEMREAGLLTKKEYERKRKETVEAM